ncbi:serine proteinase [Obba rivulosa]|uniref:Serine proteinase n=1 Tax=Obba rivulosa TaxID=1052685 RepID=A0A8E2DHC2_9APHY|nr:serine proteinase [Obba rivulosa]
MSSPSTLIEIKRASGDKKESGYIVRLKDSADKRAHLVWLRQRLSRNSSITYEYSDALKAYAGTFDESTLEHLRASSDVDEIYEDGITHGYAQQLNAPWGLNRISQRARLANQNAQDMTFVYTYPPSPGRGVDIYVLDTGVLISHTEFDNRARWGWTAPGLPSRDDNGHGTGVASVAAGTYNGVAKEANIIAVKVHNSNNAGWSSDVIAGMDFVGRDATPGRPTVVNMSLGTEYNRAVDDQVYLLTQAGIHVVAAAGNSNINADGISPARSDYCTTVAASDITDTKANFSNWGGSVDIFAPGVQILVAGNASTTAERFDSGTSFAAPFVSGIIACFIIQYGNRTPVQMIEYVQDMAVRNALADIPLATVNWLANNGNL